MKSIRHVNLLVLVICAQIVSACVSKPPPAPTEIPVTATSQPAPVAQPAASPTALSSDPQQLFASSKHAKTFVADAEGKNNDCARCHSPLNWMPTAMEDIPATCQSCKFNMPAPKPVTQSDWKNIGCSQCHKTEKGTVTKQVAWLNSAIAQFDTNGDPYEAVKSNAELCVKCHRDTFKVEMSKTVHADKTCTDCHEVHSSTASCASAKCHANTRSAASIAGHDEAHAKVTCVACHDATGLKVGPTEDKTQWTAFRTIEVGGKKTTVAYSSHNLQRQVDCARCHFDGNPWGLKK